MPYELPVDAPGHEGGGDGREPRAEDGGRVAKGSGGLDHLDGAAEPVARYGGRVVEEGERAGGGRRRATLGVKHEDPVPVGVGGGYHAPVRAERDLLEVAVLPGEKRERKVFKCEE